MRTRAAPAALRLLLAAWAPFLPLSVAAAPRVLLVPGHEEELARKVEAEAEAAGFPLLRALPGPGTQPALPELVRERSADAALALESAEVVRLHVPAVGEKPAYDAVVARTREDGDGFASRVVEQLRGRLVDLALLPEARPAASAEAATPPPVRVSTPPPPRDEGTSRTAPPGEAPMLALLAGGGASVAAGGLGAVPAVALGLRAEPGFGLAISGRALIPLTDATVSTAEGEADVDVQLFLGDIALRLLAPSPAFVVEAGAGGGFGLLPVDAEAVAPYEAANDRLVTGLFYLHAGAGFSVTSWLRLRAVVRAGLNAPRPVVRFDGEEVASWGRAFTAATLEGELGWALSSGSQAR